MPPVTNLTLPFYPGMPVGNVWPQDVPFRTEEIISYGSHNGRIDFLALHSESGTRLMTQATYDNSFPRIGELDLKTLVGVPAVVIDIPRAASEEITAADVEARVAADAEYRAGDAILIRTGWGDGERYRRIGDDYATKTPHFSDEGAARLAEVMRQKGTDLLAIDVAYIGNCAPHYMRREWVDLPPWLRTPWPSEQAKIYLRHYTPEKGHADWSASEPLPGAGFVLAALGNTGAIRTKRVLLTALPLFVAGGVGAPTTVIAKELKGQQ